MKGIIPLVAVLFSSAPAVQAPKPNDPKTVGRIFHSMVWTGKEVLVWGGGSEGVFHGTGLRIDGKTRTVMSERRAPIGRWAQAAVWSGTEMIVWGGRDRFEAEGH